MNLWLVGRINDASPWEVIGIFDNESQAVAACSTYSHFVGPLKLNETLPDERTSWPGCYYPRTS